MHGEFIALVEIKYMTTTVQPKWKSEYGDTLL